MKIKFALITLTAILVLGSCSKSGPSTPTPPTATIPVFSAVATITAITTVSASTGGIISSDGGASVTSRGVCWNTSSNPTIANSKTVDGTGTGVFASNLTGLTPGTVYYVRAYATNSVGTAYALEQSFTTLVAITLPTLAATTAASGITSGTAISGGNVTADGGAPVTSRGVCWSTSSNPTTGNSKTTDGTGTGIFTSNLTGLTANTLYYVRAYATNSVGTSYAVEAAFTTGAIPVIPTLAATTTANGITSSTATSGGNVTADGGAPVTSRGVCWSTSLNPTTANAKTTDGTGTGIFPSDLTGLNANTLYYVRAYATNSVGTAYGTAISFTSAQTGTVIVCSQVWMDKNLSVSNYRNGDPIPLVTDNATWASLTTGAYCYYNNNPATEAVYGKLYNWYAVNDPRGLAPTGWHVSTHAEWGPLTTCLGGSVVAGGALKETGTSHWNSPNTGATNSSGFTALPGGYRDNAGSYFGLGNQANWWTSSQSQPNEAFARSVTATSANIYTTGFLMVAGYPVRCIKD